jgi:hypothetical protein
MILAQQPYREVESGRPGPGGIGTDVTDGRRFLAHEPAAHAGGIKPRRLAMILSTIRFGSTAVIKCRIGSGVIW